LKRGTAQLLAEVMATAKPAIAETPEARLERLADDPVAMFAAVNGLAAPVPPAEAGSDRVSASVAEALSLVRRSAPQRQGGRRKVMHTLKATAPVRAKPRLYEDSKASPFEPSAEDRSDAIDLAPSARMLPLLTFGAAATTALLLWLLLN